MIGSVPELSARQKRILEAIIQEFVMTGEPVSSGFVQSALGMSCSSATIRSEMARLEEMGLLYQPHAASGRIPLDPAYRVFVNDIIRNRIEPPPRETAEEIDREYRSVKDKMDSLIARTADMLSRMTRYTSMVLAPRLRGGLLKYLKLVPLDPPAILLFMITTTGELVHKIIRVSEVPSPEKLDRLAESLNRRLQGIPMEDLESAVSEEAIRAGEDEMADGLKSGSRIVAPSQCEVVVSGKNNVFDFSDGGDIRSIRVMIELLEEENAVAEILSKTIDGGDIEIMIGSENPVSEMRDCSVITAAYRINSSPAGRIGILGPKRMPYRQVISIITYTAENFGERLSSL